MAIFDRNDRPWNHDSIRTTRFDEVLAGQEINDHTTVHLTFHPRQSGSRWIGVVVGEGEEIIVIDAPAVGALMEEVAHRGVNAPEGVGAEHADRPG